MHFRALKGLAIPPMPEGVTTIRPVSIAPGKTSVPLLFQNAHRQFYLVQNLSTTDELAITSVQGNTGAQIIGPSGAKIVDIPSNTTLWGVNNNPASPNGILVNVEEIIGYTPIQLYQLAVLVDIADSLQKMAGK
jgi:hypothetical protein